MISFAVPCRADGELIDIVGTGGDGLDTFNVSTAASFVISAAGGRVAKQGNRSSSGKCGSADFIEALGVPLALANEHLEQAIASLGFGFLFAQSYHPSLKSVGKIRKEIGVKTVFNILGPLSNPASPTYMLLGVGSPQLGPLYAEVLRRKQVKRGFVVHSDEGMDEISPCGPSTIWMVEDGNITTKRVSPVEDFGLEKAHSLEELAGGSAVDNVATFKKILAGEEKGPVLDYILVNAGCALHVANLAPDLASGVSLARSAISSGKVAKLVDDYIALTNSLHSVGLK